MVWTRAVAAMMVIALLSGCASEDSGPGPDDQEREGEQGDAGGTQTPDDEEPPSDPEEDNETVVENRIPEVQFSANIQNGTQPLLVNFTLNASDADEDPLTWSFDADGDGEPELEGDSLPASFNHTYEIMAEHTATARVSDGQDTAASSLRISVQEQTITAVKEEWMLSWPDCDTGRFMSQTATSEFGCSYTFQTANLVVSQDGALEHDFPADGPTAGFPADSPVQVDLEIGIVGPYAGSLTARLLADGELVGEAEAQNVGPDASPVEIRSFHADFATDMEIAEGASLTFILHMETAGYMEFQSGNMTIG